MASYGAIKLNDGHEIPAIGYGTGSVMKGTDVTAYVEQAIEVGFSHIDTAEVYATEPYVGKAIKETGLARNELFVTTKYFRGDDARGSVQGSLSRLGLKFVDLYLIHGPRTVTNFEFTWRQFEQIKEEGLAKSIGVSNFMLDDLQKLLKIAKIKPAVNQIELHPYNYAKMKPLIDFQTEHGIITEAYSGLTPITKQPGGPVDQPLQTIAKRIGGTPEQVLLAWLKHKGVVIVTTSSKKERLQSYLEVPELPALTDEEIVLIDEAGAKGPSSLRQFAFRRISLVTFVLALCMVVRFANVLKV